MVEEKRGSKREIAADINAVGGSLQWTRCPPLKFLRRLLMTGVESSLWSLIACTASRQEVQEREGIIGSKRIQDNNVRNKETQQQKQPPVSNLLSSVANAVSAAIAEHG